MRDPSLLGFQVADADALLPPEVAPPWVRGAGTEITGQAVTSVQDVVAVDEQAARLAVLGPDVKEVAVGVEDLNPTVASGCDEYAAPGVDLDVVGITESRGLPALGADTTPYGLDEGAVARELDDAVVPAPVPIRDPDISVGCDRDPRRSVEVALVVSRDCRLPQPHHHLSLPG